MVAPEPTPPPTIPPPTSRPPTDAPAWLVKQPDQRPDLRLVQPTPPPPPPPTSAVAPGAASAALETVARIAEQARAAAAQHPHADVLDEPAVEPPEPTHERAPDEVVESQLDNLEPDAVDEVGPGELDEGQDVRAPLDVRARAVLGEILASRPRWSQRPPSTAEIWEWANTGDWTASESAWVRLPRALVVVLAFVLIEPVDWALRIARQKPIGFVLLITVLIVANKIV